MMCHFLILISRIYSVLISNLLDGEVLVEVWPQLQHAFILPDREVHEVTETRIPI